MINAGQHIHRAIFDMLTGRFALRAPGPGYVKRQPPPPRRSRASLTLAPPRDGALRRERWPCFLATMARRRAAYATPRRRARLLTPAISCRHASTISSAARKMRGREPRCASNLRAIYARWLFAAREAFRLQKEYALPKNKMMISRRLCRRAMPCP